MTPVGAAKRAEVIISAVGDDAASRKIWLGGGPASIPAGTMNPFAGTEQETFYAVRPLLATFTAKNSSDSARQEPAWPTSS